MTNFLTLATLKQRIRIVADKMSTKIIRESSDLISDTESEFDPDQEYNKDIEQHCR